MLPQILLGASTELVQRAATALGVTFPPELVTVWTIANGLDLPDDWRFFPVFDARNARKTTNDIVYENTRGRWEIMAPDLVAIAHDGSGNSLVLRKVGQALDPIILFWDHETQATEEWEHDLAYVAEQAKARITAIEKQIARAAKRRA